MFLSLAVPSPLLSKIITSHLKSQRSKHIAALYVTIQPKKLITTKWGYTSLIGDHLNIGLLVLNALKEEKSLGSFAGRNHFD